MPVVSVLEEAGESLVAALREFTDDHRIWDDGGGA
jgi:hypothetical protein